MASEAQDTIVEELKNLLRKLFQFESADLDFGIYRIMNQKRDVIERFIEKDLIQAVDGAFQQYSSVSKGQIEEELKGMERSIRADFGPDAINELGGVKKEFENLPKLKEYAAKKQELAGAEITDQQKSEIFSHIIQFFSRYYKDGDFISLRRYSKDNKYAIPYNGEEVVLHWANKDQYYIKTGENFKDYSFKAGGYTVHFKLSEAEITKGNVKGDKRFFILKDSEDKVTVDEEKMEIVIPFEYRGLTEEESKNYGTRNIQEKIIEETRDTIFAELALTPPASSTPTGSTGPQTSPHSSPLRKDMNGKTLLESHLIKYTKKNTSDYFIHKDLKGFLDRELDFYIKNEIFNLDDLGTEREVSIERYVTKVKVFKSISRKIIEFLAQIEDFQKKLWEKKKFVIRTDYCMTLDRVPEEFYPEIVKNEAQIAEWKELYAIQDIQPTVDNVRYQEPMTTEFLKSNQYLVLDTHFFNDEFKIKLNNSFEGFEDQCNGLLIRSENYHALNLLINVYRNYIECIYLDPPYNTGNDGFLYQDNYQHSSWLAMLENRYTITRQIMREKSVIFTSIDDGEHQRLNNLQSLVFGEENFISNIIWQKKFSPQNDAKWLSDNHDFITCFSKNKSLWRPNLLPRTAKANLRYSNPDNDPRGDWMSGGVDVKTYNPDYDYPITTPSGRIVRPPGNSCWRFSQERLMELIAENRIWYGETGSNVPRIKRFLSEVKQGITCLTVWEFKEVGHTQEGAQELNNIMGPGRNFSSPKVVKLLLKILQISVNKNSTILDYFAGSGTTAHAVLNLNREDGGNRKYILVEMGDYFDTVMIPRIKKVMYSKDWKDGKPTSRNSGISHMFKYQYLEQYEDTLNNIEFMKEGKVQKTLEDMDDYMLRYMLDFETRDSPCRLNVDKLIRPFEYKLKITEGNETKEQVVDLVETFNYLLGIHVRRLRAFEREEGTYYRVVYGFKGDGNGEGDGAGGSGTGGEEYVVIWRNADDLDLEKDREFISDTILRDTDPAWVYVNADCYHEKARPIEPEFSKLMGG